MQVFERRVLTYTPQSRTAGRSRRETSVSTTTRGGTQTRQTGHEDPNPPAPPAVNVTVSASVSNASPAQYSNVTVYGTFKNNGQPVSGVQMDTTWHYKTTTSSCSGTTGTVARHLHPCDQRRHGRLHRDDRCDLYMERANVLDQHQFHAGPLRHRHSHHQTILPTRPRSARMERTATASTPVGRVLIMVASLLDEPSLAGCSIWTAGSVERRRA